MKPDSTGLIDFIDGVKIWETVNSTTRTDAAQVHDILDKAVQAKGLSLEETARLLQVEDPELNEAIFETARKVKQGIYGNRLVLFAPLYVTNECGNRCAYCGFKDTNKELLRRTLSADEIRQEVTVLENQGHKRLLLVYGEHPRFGAEWIAETVRNVYDTVSEKSGEIRRVNINCAPLDVEGFRKLHEVGIGTYQCFQETYHRETYAELHPTGYKKDYLWRLHAMHRAMEAGIDDVGMGTLLGLYDYRFDTIALLSHAAELEAKYGVGPHTLSFPRLEPALNSDIAFNPPYPISDAQFKRLVAVLRLAVPYTGLILSTRENREMRRELLDLGISQLSAGSRTYPGAYSDPDYDRPDVQQFCIGDNRSLEEVIGEIVEHGYVPSWCTACYRAGRTGEHFMELAKKGFIQRFCHPNALLTFKEYLLDYAQAETQEQGNSLISHELEGLAEKRRTAVADRLNRIEHGERDLYL
ncbi:[FeFe] hydrogenase H-cluster radical SAM maturase HydG [Maridesulfovibrio salexigens]|uniref:Biotin and thiamin synthesis associated n=1 Tax=Maridesulfovibrio salexigens (strain ATCC 14822 / DSM 2638 / NCIMB 8403 / VKM B-1763) TaxID=526222 RepID=C6BWV4_MARSD|nr:[FeFe] hydrogenase H-cluster radical SAM maturase HydG [Maridesulfovibrio salexigens]ACS78434.1 biotin and thiamin synthesis associated [Maridesulfovibrio salexigens DSM 2638]